MTGVVVCLKNADLFLQEPCVFVEKRAEGGCEYCHVPQHVCRYRFLLEHVIPSVRGGSDLAVNRAITSAPCNLVKAAQVLGIDPDTGSEVPLFNPRTKAWAQYSRWGKDCQMLIGRTPMGRATVIALD